MADITQSHVQRIYRPLIIGFVVLAVGLIGGVLYTSAGGTTIRVIPTLTSVTSTFSVTITPTPAGEADLTGTVAAEPLTASVTATPSAEGAEVPAHATGQVTIKNTSGGSQALAASTRLQHDNGVIVRTTTRLDIPARGQVEATVVADPLGVEGNLPPGRFTIVALRPANQLLIYGESAATLTGGLTKQSGSLSLEALTNASNEAEKKIRADFGVSTVGAVKDLLPVSVGTEPASNKPAASYMVTVTMKGLTVAFDQGILDALIHSRLTVLVKDDQELASTETPIITVESQPTTDSAVLNIVAAGLAQIKTDSPVLAPSQFVGLDQDAITKKLLGSSLVKSVTVDISPWWRSKAAETANKITVQRIAP